jgi:hypothetical protein
MEIQWYTYALYLQMYRYVMIQIEQLVGGFIIKKSTLGL